MSKKNIVIVAVAILVLIIIGWAVYRQIAGADTYSNFIVKNVGFTISNDKDFVQDGDIITYKINYDLTKSWPPGKVKTWRIIGEAGIKDVAAYSQDPSNPKARHKINLYLGKIKQGASGEALVQVDATGADTGSGKTINLKKKIAQKPKGTIEYKVKANGQGQAVFNAHGVLTYTRGDHRYIAAIAGDTDGVIQSGNALVNTLWLPMEITDSYKTEVQIIKPLAGSGCTTLAEHEDKDLMRFVNRTGMVYNPDSKTLIRFGKNEVKISGNTQVCSRNLPYYMTNNLKIKTNAEGKLTFETAPMRGYEKGQQEGANLPKVTEDPMMAYDPVGKTTILLDEDGKTWRYDDRNDQWSVVNSPADAVNLKTKGSKLVTVEDKVYLLNGTASSIIVMVFDGKNNAWMPLNVADSPAGRTHFSAAYSPDMKKIIVFGGYLGGNYKKPINSNTTNELWILDAQTNKWSKISGGIAPSARGFGSLIYHQKEKAFVLIGGVNKKQRLAYDANYLLDLKDSKAVWQNLDSIVSLYSPPTDPKKSVRYNKKLTLPVPPVAAPSSVYLPDVNNGQGLIMVLGNTNKLNPITKGFVEGRDGYIGSGEALIASSVVNLLTMLPYAPAMMLTIPIATFVFDGLFNALGIFQKKPVDYSVPFGAQLWGYGFARQKVTPNSPLPAIDNSVLESGAQNYIQDPQVQAENNTIEQALEQTETSGQSISTPEDERRTDQTISAQEQAGAGEADEEGEEE